MASRKEEKERLRQERLERERAAAASAGKRKRLGLIAAAVLGLAALGAVIAVAAGGGGDGGGGSANGGGGGGGDFPKVDVPPRKVEDLEDAAKAAGCVLTEPKNEGAGHTDDDAAKVKYKSNPPTSGEHNPTPAGDGVFPDGAKPERLVHSLEHGRVVFHYAADAPPRVRGALKAVYDEDKAIVALTKNLTDMPYEVAATAWDKLLACKTYNDRVPDALRAFREENRLKGPEFVPNMEPPS